MDSNKAKVSNNFHNKKLLMYLLCFFYNKRVTLKSCDKLIQLMTIDTLLLLQLKNKRVIIKSGNKLQLID